jgi:NTE family protein
MVRKTRIFKPNLHHDGGMADYTHLRKMMAKYIPYNSFDSLKIPFYCCVSDMNHLKPVYVSTGDKLREYVSASASVPRVFAPVMIDSVYYVDGYIFNNLPVEPLIDAGCNVTIGLYIQRDTVMERIDDPSIISSRAFAVNSNLCTLDHVHLCTYGIAIKVGDLGKLDFGKIDEFFEYGYKAGKEFLEELCGVEAKKDTKD